MKIRLTIPGTPIAKARPKFFRRGDHVGTYKPKEQLAAEHVFKCHVSRHAITPILAGRPLRLKCWFFMPIPKSATKKFHKQCDVERVPHVKKPDLDNLVKFVKDCLNGLAWHDDSQVAEIAGMKVYDTRPRTVVEIEVLDEAVRQKKE